MPTHHANQHIHIHHHHHSYNLNHQSTHIRDMFCAGRVTEEDLKRTMFACGGSIQSSVSSLRTDVLGSCELFEEMQIGGERCACVGGCFV